MNNDLIELRNKFAENFKRESFKETHLDSYKFTKLETFFQDVLSGGEASSEIFPESDSPITTIICKNGVWSGLEMLPEGLIVKNLSENFKEVKDLFQRDNAVSNLHHSKLEGGLIIEVPKNTLIKKPLRVLHQISEAKIEAVALVIKVGVNSGLTLIEETLGLNSTHAQLSETYIFADMGSNVEHIAIDKESENGLSHGSLFVEVEKDANFKGFIFHTAGKMNRKNLKLNLKAPGANGESYALFLTQNKEHSDINTEINHLAADTTSNQVAKGILDDESKGIFTGKIHIHPKAQRVKSGQINKNLILSQKAQVHSQPQLEIFADDVKCSHGSTTGQLSDDEVFYLEARGIPADRARSILAMGFGLEVVLKISDPLAQSHVNALIKNYLAEKFQIGGAK